MNGRGAKIKCLATVLIMCDKLIIIILLYCGGNTTRDRAGWANALHVIDSRCVRHNTQHNNVRFQKHRRSRAFSIPHVLHGRSLSLHSGTTGHNVLTYLSYFRIAKTLSTLTLFNDRTERQNRYTVHQSNCACFSRTYHNIRARERES